MSLQEHCFISLKNIISAYKLPKKFTFPFYYQPHPLCLFAAQELQNYLQKQTQWQHNFGLTDDKEGAIGKMFGVLLVQNKQNEIGYLTAFSGKLAGKNHLGKFVPPVFDLLLEDGFFLADQQEINKLNQQLEALQQNPKILEYELFLKAETDLSNRQIKNQKQVIIEARKVRKAQRIASEKELNAQDFQELKEQLAKQSIQAKKELKQLSDYWATRIHHAEKNLQQLTHELTLLKQQRKTLSAQLQNKIFAQYCFLNSKGQAKSLYSIFIDTLQRIPPAGSGECATPKLLQYAFKHQMKPLAMAEFWWGASPKSAVRTHQNFYAACQGKCQPILTHMLEDIEMDENPLLINPGKGKHIQTVYEDSDILVINKPENFLSVPGKNIEDSVYTRIKQSHPLATGPLIVHRLDMSTSGLMLIALSKEAHKILQRQFIKRIVKKRYVALLDGLLTKDHGTIELPLRVDLDDRPRQQVCYEHGKYAKTQWQLIEHNNSQSRVYFYPLTGRTHQLRVHAAHVNGLNTPIVGDDLYGKQDIRLHLHAEQLEFEHPISRQWMQFQLTAEF